MQVRAANINDAEAVGQIRVAAWQAAYRDFMPHEFLESLDPGMNLDGLRAIIASENPPFQLRIAEDNGSAVGFSMYGAPRYAALPGTLELWALNTLPVAWRKGVGRLLVQDTLAAARKAKFERVELWCIAGNSAATSLYESLGFVPTGESRTTSNLTGLPLHERAFVAAP